MIDQIYRLLAPNEILVDDWTQVCTNILTSLGVIAAFVFNTRSLNAVKRQTESSYLPAFVIPMTHTETHIKHGIPSIQININKTNLSTEYLEIRNIGLGTAKNVSATWEFPRKKWIQQINERNKKRGEAPMFAISDKNVVSNITKRSYSLALSQGAPLTVFDHIQPIKIEDKPYKISLPALFSEALLADGLLLFQQPSNPLSQYWSMTLKINFFDIAHNKHETKFTIKTAIEYCEESSVTVLVFAEPIPRSSILSSLFACLKPRHSHP